MRQSQKEHLAENALPHEDHTEKIKCSENPVAVQFPIKKGMDQGL